MAPPPLHIAMPLEVLLGGTFYAKIIEIFFNATSEIRTN